MRRCSHTSVTQPGERAHLPAAHDFAEFVPCARFVGTKTVDGRPVFHLRAEGLEDAAIAQPQSGPQFTLKAASLWVDTEKWLYKR